MTSSRFSCKFAAAQMLLPLLQLLLSISDGFLHDPASVSSTYGTFQAITVHEVEPLKRVEIVMLLILCPLGFCC